MLYRVSLNGGRQGRIGRNPKQCKTGEDAITRCGSTPRAAGCWGATVRSAVLVRFHLTLALSLCLSLSLSLSLFLCLSYFLAVLYRLHLAFSAHNERLFWTTSKAVFSIGVGQVGRLGENAKNLGRGKFCRKTYTSWTSRRFCLSKTILKRFWAFLSFFVAFLHVSDSSRLILNEKYA